MSTETIETVEAYSINGNFVVDSAHQLTPTSVTLHIDDLPQMTAPGDTILVQVHGLWSENGRSTKNGRGDMIALAVSAGAENGEFKVYPNPFVKNKGAETITFANVKSGAKIQILTSHGQLVRTLRNNDGEDDLKWDLTNENGEIVASGIYIYRVSGSGVDIIDKLAIVK